MRIVATCLIALAPFVQADTLPFLTDQEITAFATEVSGDVAKRNLEGLSRHHRMRGSRGFRASADQILAELKRYGFDDAHLESLPADGTIFYGTQRSRPPWNAEFAELWEVDESGSRVVRLASWEAAPITLAQDSVSGEATAELIDVGAGTSAADYEGKDVKGKLVLTSTQPGPVAKLAVAKYGAAGIISYAQNQRTAWFGEDENLVRWGHLDAFAPENERTFAFMVSLKTARSLQQRLARGTKIRLHATVRAGQEPGAYEIATATIRGASLPDEEIVFSCHLDHPRPGANDNASGCATILEVARTLSTLLKDQRIPRPKRTIRFVWPPEIEGTLALLNGRPELAKRIKAAIHLDMVGGGPETKAIFHITRGPASQPSFVYDVAEAIGEVVNEQSAELAMTGSARWPMVAPGGGKEPLRAAMVPLTLGSDHHVYTDSSFGIPAIYLNDWPDRYIHTNQDVAGNMDATKLGRVAFLAATSGYVLARLDSSDAAALATMMKAKAMKRTADALRRNDPNALRFALWYERTMTDSMSRFFTVPADVRKDSAAFYVRLQSLLGVTAPKPPVQASRVYRRNSAIKGPMEAFGYDYFNAHYTKDVVKLSGEKRYEALNLVDGRRSVSEIRDALDAIYGPTTQEDVEQYLAALASINVILPLGNAP